MADENTRREIVPLGRDRPSRNTCPSCRGDFTWTPETVEKVAQQLRPYMSDEDAVKATEGVRRALENQ